MDPSRASRSALFAPGSVASSAAAYAPEHRERLPARDERVGGSGHSTLRVEVGPRTPRYGATQGSKHPSRRVGEVTWGVEAPLRTRRGGCSRGSDGPPRRVGKAAMGVRRGLRRTRSGETPLGGMRGNGGLPSDCAETSVRNRRVSRGLAPTSGQQSEPAPTTGTLSTCRRRCSVGFARWGGLANPTGHFRRRVRAVAFSTQWEPPTSIQRRSARKLSFLGPRLCDGFRVCVSAELRAFPASLLRNKDFG